MNRRQRDGGSGQARELTQHANQAKTPKSAIVCKEERTVTDQGGKTAENDGSSGIRESTGDGVRSVDRGESINDVDAIVRADSQGDRDGDEVQKVELDSSRTHPPTEPEQTQGKGDGHEEPATGVAKRQQCDDAKDQERGCD
jgi:hypothetical protein